MIDFLKLIVSRLCIILVCVVVLIVCVNEVSARGWLGHNPLKATPLTTLTWQNLLAGPSKWQSLGWLNWKAVSHTTPAMLAKLPAPILKLAGHSSPSAALSASFSASQTAQLATASAATTAAQPSTPSAQLLSGYWQKFQHEVSQIWDRTKTVASATQTFVRTQLFAPAPQNSGSTSATPAPLEQRALEYAKYMYCKETVTTYEKLNPAVVASNAAVH